MFQVEAILLKHPGVASAVVVGLPDTRFTEMVVACIQIKDSWKWADYSSDHSDKDDHQCLSSEILKKFCKEKNLTGYFSYFYFYIYIGMFSFDINKSFFLLRNVYVIIIFPTEYFVSSFYILQVQNT